LHSDSAESEEGLGAPNLDDESGADVDSGLVTTNKDARSKRKARLPDSSSRNGKRVKQISPEPPLHGNSDSAESEEQLGAPDFDDESGADPAFHNVAKPKGYDRTLITKSDKK
jgi:hypothetical protein